MSTKILSSPHPNFPDGLDIRVNTRLKRRETIADDELDPIIDQPVEEYGIAGRVWEAADVLIDYFSTSSGASPTCSIFDFRADPNSNRPTRKIIELGSGTGYVGLKLAELLVNLERNGDLVILTDLPDVCPLLEKNLGAACVRLGATLDASKSETLKSIVRTVPLSWGNYDEAAAIFQNHLDAHFASREVEIKDVERPLSHIVCSDLVYFPSLLGPLLRSLLHLTSPPFCSGSDTPEVIIGYRVRSLAKETAFWTAFGLWFEYDPVLQQLESEGEASHNLQLFGQSSGSDDVTFIFVARRRSGSLDWNIPPDDDDLLGGVGALGTNFRKGDDYFERLLLMQLDLGD